MDAPKSQVIIFEFLGNERLAVYGRFLVLWLRVSTQKNTVTTTSSLLLDFIQYEGRRFRISHLSVALPYIMQQCNKQVGKSDSLPFIPNKIEQNTRRPIATVFLCRNTQPQYQKTTVNGQTLVTQAAENYQLGFGRVINVQSVFCDILGGAKYSGRALPKNN